MSLGSFTQEKDTDIGELGKYLKEHGEDCVVRVKGFVDVIRTQGKKMIFLIVSGGTGKVQVPLLKNVLKEFSDQKELLKKYSAVDIEGLLHTDERAPEGYEILAKCFKVFKETEPCTLIGKDDTPFHRFEYRHIHLRHDRTRDVLKVRHYVTKALREFFYSRKLYEMTPPTITKQECEGGANLFKFDYYSEEREKTDKDGKTYIEEDKVEAVLTQSSQLYLEAACPSLKHVFCIMPSFRKEKSATRRHLSEFTHCEAELSFISFDDLLEFLETMVKTMVTNLLEDSESAKILMKIHPELPKILEKPFKRMRYSEAIEFCKTHEIYKNEEKKEFFEYGDDIPEAPERKMTDMIGEPIFLTHFPAKMKAFYMEKDPENSEETLSVDLLIPSVGEIVGGSMRMWDYDELIKGFEQFGIDPTSYYWYTDLRKYGSFPHGGFGLGIERFVMWLTKETSVKECCLFPRFLGRCTP